MRGGEVDSPPAPAIDRIVAALRIALTRRPRPEAVSGPTATAGIREGDLVLSVNGTPVKDAAQLARLVADKSQVALLIKRGQGSLFVPVPLG